MNEIAERLRQGVDPDDIPETERAMDAGAAEIEWLTEQVRNRDYALNRLGEKKADEIARLTTERDSARVSNSIETDQHLGWMEIASQRQAEIARLKAALLLSQSQNYCTLCGALNPDKDRRALEQKS